MGIDSCARVTVANDSIHKSRCVEAIQRLLARRVTNSSISSTGCHRILALFVNTVQSSRAITLSRAVMFG